MELLEAELNQIKYKKRYRRVLKSTLYTLITVAAVVVLVASLWMPVMRTYGSSMSPTLCNGEIVVSLKSGKPKRGDIVAFYYNNKVLVKRVIACPGEWVHIDEDGTVSVNGKKLVEPYVSELSYGDADIEFPYQIPDGKYFVLGDQRATSADSRHTAVGCVEEGQLAGRIFFRVWPMEQFGPID